MSAHLFTLAYKTLYKINQSVHRRLNKRSLLKVITIAGLFIFNQAIQAQTKYYDVEVIIYEDADATYLDAENWQDEAGFQQLNPADVTTLQPVAGQKNISPTPVQPVLDNKIMDNKIMDNKIIDNKIIDNKITDNNPVFKNIDTSILKKEAKYIRYSKHYNLLFYAAWSQPGLDAKDAIAIKLSDLVNHAKLKTKNSIQGTLKVVLSRYLHFYTRLDYLHHEMAAMPDQADNQNENNGSGITTTALQETADASGGDETDSINVPVQSVPVIRHYPIIAHRRMRSKVLHYIDFPLVGILVQINPVKQVAAPIDKTGNNIATDSAGSPQ